MASYPASTGRRVPASETASGAFWMVAAMLLGYGFLLTRLGPRRTLSATMALSSIALALGWWGVRAGRFALALLDRPRDQVAQALWRNWDLVTSPETTIERLGEVLGVQPPPPGSPNPPDSGGPGC